MKRIVFSLLLCFAVALSASTLNALTQTTVGYLQQTRSTYPHIPSSVDGSGRGVGAGYYAHFNLPGYGDVGVDVEPNNGGPVPQLTWVHSTAAELHMTSNGKIDWGTDTDYLHFLSVDKNQQPIFAHYTITFSFNSALNPLTPKDLFLVVFGFADGTTAKVYPGGGTNVGEYTIPVPPQTMYPTSPTAFASGTLYDTFSSGFNAKGTDSNNTGWDLYQPKSLKSYTLTLTVDQIPGDGIGFTLGYRVCPTLVGNSVDTGLLSLPHLYDINTTTGGATNPRQAAAYWRMAFSPMSPSGTLYALDKVGALFVVDPVTGAATLDTQTSFPSTVFWGGGIAADPTTGILYGLDDSVGQLFTYNGVLTPGQTIKYASPYYFSTMAFDHSGELFMVDASKLQVVKVDPTTGNAGAPKPLTPPITPLRGIRSM